eukprot:TRINITY_DN55479_c0_g1_i1.p1 TRINITY_DN55479_c0_g1~~TRINITY_DN55479_c0_g1_i1.p1  ORF type:complete len:895 (-),score=141.57 TRINITY_DN55479_c0_g1_i1:35-2365(-)
MEDGRLHYKTFARDFVAGLRRVAGQSADTGDEMLESVEQTLMRMKIFLYMQGPCAITQLATAFREADVENLRSIDYEAFACITTNFFEGGSCHLTDKQIDQVFHLFRQPHGPSRMAYDELFFALKEELSSERRGCVRAAFRRLDKDREGVVDINHMMKSFSANRHPQVSDGSRQPQEVMHEFSETLQNIVAFRRGQRSYPSDLIAWEEFEDYYMFINGCFETDELFCASLTRVWDLDKQKESTSETKHVAAAPAAGCPAKSRADLHHWQTNTLPRTHQDSYASVDLQNVIDRVRGRIRSTGVRGAVELVRNFYVADDDVDDMLDVHEFRRACQQSRLMFAEKEEASLFGACGDGPALREGSRLSLQRFLKLLQGELSPKRLAAIEKAWADVGCDPRDENSVISPAAFKKAYRAEAHPSLRPDAGPTPEDMLAEFLDTFALLAHVRGGCQNGMVSFSDFFAYYEVISSTIDNDAFFELTMRRLWGSLGDELGQRRGLAPNPGVARRTQRGVNYETSTSPMAEPRPPAHSGPSAYSTSSDQQQHRRFVRKEVPIAGGGYDTGPTPTVAGVSPITKSSIVFSGSDSSELGLVVTRLRQNIAKRGIRSWKSLAEKFQQYDNKKNGGIMRMDFERVLKTMGFGLSAEEREALFKGFSIGRRDGAMDYRACIQRLKGWLPEPRQGLVDALFDWLRGDADSVDPQDLKRSFNPQNTPECMLSKKDPRMVAQDFVEAVDFFRSAGRIGREDFYDFFAMISAIHPGEEEFEFWCSVAFGFTRGSQ